MDLKQFLPKLWECAPVESTSPWPNSNSPTSCAKMLSPSKVFGGNAFDAYATKVRAFC